MAAPWLSLLRSPVRVELWLMRILFGTPEWVRTTNGSKVVVPADVLMVLAAALVPHQLSVAVTGLPRLFRFFPVGAVLFASRLNCTESGPLMLRFPDAMPPPVPVAVVPVIVTLASEPD